MSPEHRTLLTSIHDVSPRFESEIEGLLDLVEPHVGRRLAMLVVPNHWGGAPIIAGSPFGTRLRNWADAGIEMFLHGYFHRDDSVPQSSFDRFKAHFMTAGEGEFLSLPREAAANRINEGQELIEDVIGRPIAGFVAPAWLYGRGALDALRDNAVSLAEDHMRIWSPKTGKQLAQGPVITWASRTRMRLASSLAAAALLRHAPLSVLRVGVHPPDVHHPAIVRSIARTLEVASASRRCAGYRDLLVA